MRMLTVLLSALAVAVAPAVAAAEVAEPPPAQSHVVYQRAAFRAGTAEGVAAGRALSFRSPAGTMEYTDALGTKTWEYARWTGPEQAVGFPATELIASWTADTPPGTWIQVEMRGTSPDTKWYVLGRWAYGDADIRRTSVSGQRDADGTVSVDTFVAAGGRPIDSYRLRVTLHRLPGTARGPVVRSLGAMASAVPDRADVPASPAGGAWGIELPVPRRSQNVHEGHYPEWDGGGEAWCSPTSTTMVMGRWHRLPTRKDTAWVDPADPDPEVDHAARHTYDYDYEGAGNWPFNTAYAGHHGLDGFVTRLRSLTELERMIRYGIPVITSQSFKAEELPGAGYSTNGHLMVIIGFTRTGDVIANDPASKDNEAVRRVYPRAAFERVWQRSTGGISYIIRPPHHPLPPSAPGLPANW
ncbi:C39 family peptidase [Bailinhaonella thermotolerans]|uniref:Peptidase C39 family protein n=1 Tax=Bailinhaonella thermotolerans TaxID=1070861 RepID=A0A3A4AXF1_9ACTN|nr:C39 family peptidase [Bailinhaonella thermotolerans]RJL35332.1 peptidase C39 family protein [Bailinhaonella thermotolerans]